ncbi:MAG: hypothetical protein R3F40_16420 [Candidatus Competibacteraceae bacterium]
MPRCCQWLVSEAIRRLGAGPVALTGSLGPVVTCCWVGCCSTRPSAARTVGAALVIAGVTVMTRR